jgi:hypothetical protein
LCLIGTLLGCCECYELDASIKVCDCNLRSCLGAIASVPSTVSTHRGLPVAQSPLNVLGVWHILNNTTSESSLLYYVDGLRSTEAASI